jgi:hypothetical protein
MRNLLQDAAAAAAATTVAAVAGAAGVVQLAELHAFTAGGALPLLLLHAFPSAGPAPVLLLLLLLLLWCVLDPCMMCYPLLVLTAAAQGYQPPDAVSVGLEQLCMCCCVALLLCALVLCAA